MVGPRLRASRRLATSPSPAPSPHCSSSTLSPPPPPPAPLPFALPFFLFLFFLFSLFFFFTLSSASSFLHTPLCAASRSSPSLAALCFRPSAPRPFPSPSVPFPPRPALFPPSPPPARPRAPPFPPRSLVAAIRRLPSFVVPSVHLSLSVVSLSELHNAAHAHSSRSHPLQNRLFRFLRLPSPLLMLSLFAPPPLPSSTPPPPRP